MRKRLGILFLFSLLKLTAYSTSVEKADSLFAEQKYTESFEIYSRLLEKEKQVSPSMLLKMAYIKEGLGGYTDALYYLNLYYLQTADKRALEQMEVLAAKNDVTGYSSNDFEFIQTIFYKYYFQLIIFLVVFSIMMLTLSYHFKKRNEASPISPAVVMLLTLGLLFFILNYGKDYNKSIVISSNTYLMSGPSAAAEVLGTLKKGNRLRITGHEDIWTEVSYDNKKGYIKNNKLRPILLN